MLDSLPFAMGLPSETVPRRAQCDRKAFLFFSVLTGLLMLTTLISFNRAEVSQSQEHAVTMAGRYLQPAKAWQFPHLARAQQLMQPATFSEFVQSRAAWQFMPQALPAASDDAKLARSTSTDPATKNRDLLRRSILMSVPGLLSLPSAAAVDTKPEVSDAMSSLRQSLLEGEASESQLRRRLGNIRDKVEGARLLAQTGQLQAARNVLRRPPIVNLRKDVASVGSYFGDLDDSTETIGPFKRPKALTEGFKQKGNFREGKAVNVALGNFDQALKKEEREYILKTGQELIEALNVVIKLIPE